MVLVCGSRSWKDEGRIGQELDRLIKEAGSPAQLTVLHGAARGADTVAAYLARRRGCKVVAVEADWNRYGKGAGPIRNQAMLDQHPDRVLAFLAQGKSNGTKDMVSRAKSSGLPVTIVNETGARATMVSGRA